MAFKDRISEFPNRYTVTDLSNNTSKTCEIVRNEGSVEEEGTLLNAENMNREVFNLIDDKYPSGVIYSVSLTNSQWGYKKWVRFPKAFSHASNVAYPTVFVNTITNEVYYDVTEIPSAEIEALYARCTVIRQAGTENLGFFLLADAPNASTAVDTNIYWTAKGTMIPDFTIKNVTISEFEEIGDYGLLGKLYSITATTTDYLDTDVFPSQPFNIVATFVDLSVYKNHWQQYPETLFEINYSKDYDDMVYFNSMAYQ